MVWLALGNRSLPWIGRKMKEDVKVLRGGFSRFVAALRFMDKTECWRCKPEALHLFANTFEKVRVRQSVCSPITTMTSFARLEEDDRRRLVLHHAA